MDAKLSENFRGGVFPERSREDEYLEHPIMPIIDTWGMMIDPEYDIHLDEASEIIQNSNTAMELVGNGYIYGYFKGSTDSNKIKYAPVLNIPILSDERWNELAAKCQRLKGGVFA